MAFALGNKQLLALIIVALIIVAVLSFFVVGMTLHPNTHHFIADAGIIWGD